MKYALSTLLAVALLGCEKEPEPAAHAGRLRPPHPALRSEKTVRQASVGVPHAPAHLGATEAPAGHGAMPHGHPPIARQGSMGPPRQPAESDGGDPPLATTGMNSLQTLEDELGQLPEELRPVYEEAYRLTFTSDQTKRRYDRASALLADLIEKAEAFAPGYRALAYAYFNQGKNQEALELYEKALEVEPAYGVGHYALAFFLVLPQFSASAGNRQKGAEHFRRAMELGVEDERQIGPRFYPEVEVGR